MSSSTTPNSLASLGALITGGGSGIGLATARLLLEQGARVVISGRDANKLAAALATLNHGGRAHAVAGDGSKPADATRIAAEATALLGSIDLLVANAGANIKERTLAELDATRWQTMLDMRPFTRSRPCCPACANAIVAWWW